jgi:hypothetical protein
MCRREIIKSVDESVAAARNGPAMMTRAVLGEVMQLPDALLRRYPELGDVTWRAGGLPPRVGGWFLGRESVSAITLWRTVFIAPGVALQPELLLHEFGHVRQFGASVWFPLRYIWESVRRGYSGNRYELEAQAFAEARLRAVNLSNHA